MRQFLEHVTGLSIYPIISFLIFFVFFLGMLLRVALMSKREVGEMEMLPLEADDDPAYDPSHHTGNA